MHQYLRHLANFARIVEAGSMKAASDLIGLAPSGLSDSVKILENRVGSPLLVRHKDGVTPTSEGERIYDAAEGIVALLDEALQTKDGDALSGPCRLSIPTEVANFAMAPVIGQLAAQHPGLKLSIFAEDEVVDHARFGRDYFLRIASKPRDQEGLRVLWTAKVTAILVASSKFVKEHQKDNIDDLSKIPLITNAKSKTSNSYPLQNPKGSISFGQTTVVSQPTTSLSLATQGAGATACLDFCAADAIHHGQVRHILAHRFAVPVSVNLLTPHKRSRRLDGPVVDAFQSMIKKDLKLTLETRT